MRINGTPVVDATKKMVLTITPKDIAKGNNKDPGACAAAQCLLRQTEAEAARVHIGRTYLKIDKKWLRFQTPKALRSEIVAFDRGGTFEPGVYTLTPLAPSDRARGKRQGSDAAGARDRGSKSRTPKKKRARHVTANVRSHGANR